jgi:type I restriction enzyme S subunit
MTPWMNSGVEAVATLVSGGTPPRDKPQYWGGQIPWITCKDMKADRLSDSSERLTEAGLEAGSRLVPAGAVLIVIRGMILARDVPVALATRPVSFNQDLKALLPKPGIDGEFLLYALKSKVRDLQQMTARAAHGTKSLLTSNISNLEIPLPPIAEQRQIAAVLSAVQRAVERQERLIALTAELKKALMHKLFTEGTRGEPLKQTEIGPVPESWSVEPLGQHVVTAQYGLSVKGSVDGATPILRMTNQVDGRIVATNLQMVNIGKTDLLKFKLERGDVLFNRTNSFELVGRTAIFDLPDDFVFASYLIRLRTVRTTLRPAFLTHYFNWDTAQARLKGIASRAVSQSNISASRLRGFLVPLPPPAEQDEIIRWFDGVDRMRAVRERQVGVLKSLFRTLLHQLMTAQVRVHDLDLSALAEADGTWRDGGPRE